MASNGLVHDLVDTVLDPVSSFLQEAINYLDSISLTASRGLYLGDFMGSIAYLGSAWTGLVSNLVASITLLATVAVVISIWRGYLQVKAGLKWW